jgi:hypothetical protein
MHTHTFLAVALLMSGLLTSWAGAGNLNPSGPPTTGTMKPLDAVEPRVAVGQADIPLTITESGSYYLTGDVTVTGIAITIEADDVVIDLSGFSITGNPGSSYGVMINGRSNVEIRNGTIRNFIRAVTDTYTSGDNIRIIGINAVKLSGAGVYFFPDNVLIKDCTFSDIGNQTSSQVFGIYTWHRAVIVNNQLYNIGNSEDADYVKAINTGYGSRVAGNSISRVGQAAASYAHGIFTLQGCQITGNTVYDIGDQTASVMAIVGSDGCTIDHNTIYAIGTNSPSVWGISAQAGCTISHNTIGNSGTHANMIYAIMGSSGGNFTNNTVSRNGTNANYAYGLYVGSGGKAVGNTVFENGKPGTSSYGIFLGDNNFVDQNSACNNAGTNMNHPGTCTYGTNHAP